MVIAAQLTANHRKRDTLGNKVYEDFDLNKQIRAIEEENGFPHMPTPKLGPMKDE